MPVTVTIATSDKPALVTVLTKHTAGEGYDVAHTEIAPESELTLEAGPVLVEGELRAVEIGGVVELPEADNSEA